MVSRGRSLAGSWGSWVAVGLVGTAIGCAGQKQHPATTGGGGAGGKTSSGGGGRPVLLGGGGMGGGLSIGLGGAEATDGPGPVVGVDALGDAACATTTEKAQQVPLDLYVMLDSSGSMLSATSATGATSKWTAVTSALQTFVQDPKSAGLGVGLQYFPLVQAGAPDTCDVDTQCNSYGPCDTAKTCSKSSTITLCESNADCTGGMGTCIRLGVCAISPSYCSPTGTQYLCTQGNSNDFCQAIPGYCRARDRCDAASYATPAVEVATLPAAAGALMTSLSAHEPDGLTPTSGALSGAIAHAQALARANPTHKVAVLLATDGLPSECEPTEIDGVAAIASAAAAGNPSIATYVIGVFAPDEMADAQTNLNALATAGGTGKAFLITTNGADVTTSFLSALNAVRSSGLSCQYKVPSVMQDGGSVDYFSVNVQFTSGTGQMVTIGNVKDHASCSATQGGWYYDVDPATGAAPQTISICDTSCKQMQADPAGKVDILLGCKTIIIVG
jgi:hypothetical protein